MYDFNKPFVLCVDDDPDILRQLTVFLGDRYNIITAQDGAQAMQTLVSIKPSLILLDIMMPEMDGYEFSSRLQENPDTAWIPVIFVSALGQEQDKVRAFAAGAVDYLTKPVNRHTVRQLVELHQKTGQRWQMTRSLSTAPSSETRSPPASVQDQVCQQLNLTGDEKEQLQAALDKDVYAVAEGLGLDQIEVARCIAQHKGVPFVEFIDPDSVKLGSLPAPFSRANSVVVINWRGLDTLVLSNPYDLVLLDSLNAVLEPYILENVAVTDPGNIALFFEKEHAPYLADRIVGLAVKRQAQEIRVDAEQEGYSIKYLEGEKLIEQVKLKQEMGFRLIARFKVFAGMAAMETRVVDGMYAHPVGNKSCQLRLSLAHTNFGESLVIRIMGVS